MEAQSLCIPLWIEKTLGLGFFSFFFGETPDGIGSAATSHQKPQQST